MQRRIEIIGSLGCGKTTLLDNTSWASIGKQVVLIKEDLSDIASERHLWTDHPGSNSFFIQTVYYLHRVKQVLTCAKNYSQESIFVSDFGLVCDHYIYSTAFYRMGWLLDLELKALEMLNSFCDDQLPTLSGVIYRRCTASKIIERLQVRMQKCGDMDDVQGLVRMVTEECERYISSINDLPVLVVEHDIFSEQHFCIEKMLKDFFGTL